MVMEGERGADHPTSMDCLIEWTEPNVSAHLEARGIEKAIGHSFNLWVKEELRLPKTHDGPQSWSGNEDLHPFWAIKRQKEGIEINCHIRRQIVEHTTTMDFAEGLSSQGANISGLEATAMYVFYPFIVNNRKICKGDEVVLRRDKDIPQQEMKRQLVTAFDQLRKQYSKTTHSK